MFQIDLANIDTQRIGRMGELVVELELLARGWLVGNFNATTMNSAGWDLFATKGGRTVKIRVKAKRPGTSSFVWSKKRSGRVFDVTDGDDQDYVAAVSFEAAGSPAIYVLPSSTLSAAANSSGDMPRRSTSPNACRLSSIAGFHRRGPASWQN